MNLDGILRSEKEVPRLPVPVLSESLQQVLVALKPLLTAEENDELLEEVSAFLANENIQLIQQHLQAASENSSVTCYLNAVNGETYPGIYGDLRDGTLPRNPFLVLEEDPYAMTINPPNQAQRAASLVNSLLKFIVTMRNGTLKTDTAPKSGRPLTMNCYRNLFGTTRVPEAHHLVSIKKYRHFNDLRHVVLLCNNLFYALDVLTPSTAADPNHRLWFSDAELAKRIQHVMDLASAVDRVLAVNNGVGSITTQTYTQWALARAELERSSPATLDQIDDALFIVVLDTTAAPVSDQEKTTVISHGTSILAPGTNIQVGSCTLRWYDKLQLVVTANAVAGVVWESSSMDSTALLRFVSDIYTDLILKLARNINGAANTLFDTSIQVVSMNSDTEKPQPLLLHFNKTPELSNIVHLSETRLADLLNQHEFRTSTIKLDTHMLGKFQLLVDSFLQVCFQITNYALYGRLVNTLEPITTRKFQDARTELVAVQNDAIASLAKLFITSADEADRWDHFTTCCRIHTDLYRDAMLGKGFERHLSAIHQVLSKPAAIANLNRVNYELGLPPIPPRDVLAQDPIPLIFSKLFEKLTNAELLISNCGNPAMRLFGIPPAIDQGFGIGYIIHKEKVVITVLSKHRQTERFLDTFRSVVSGIKHIVRSKVDLKLTLADTESRRQEMKRLRIQKELGKINKHSPLTRHPIDIALSLKGTQESEPQTPDAPDVFEESKADDYMYLGGYGYFDVGQVTIRTDELSRAESFMRGLPMLGSSRVSRVPTRHQSLSDLEAMGKSSILNDLRERLLMSGRIRDQLPPSDGSSMSLDSVAALGNKSQVGRSIGA